MRVAVLLRKQGRQRVVVEPDYCGFDIPDAFVVGYGLDYNDQMRHFLGEGTTQLCDLAGEVDRRHGLRRGGDRRRRRR